MRVGVHRAATWARRHPSAAAALVYLVLSVTMFAPGLAPGRTLSPSDALWTATPWDASRPADIAALGSNNEEGDAVTQFQPALLRTRGALPDIPLWDPSLLNGRPFLADPQAAVFSPFSVPAYVLPFWRSLAIIAMLKLFVAACGGFALGRTVGMRFGGALLTGLVFGFSLWMVTWVSWPHASVWAFLPWVCVFAERCVRRPGAAPAAGLAAAVGLQFLGGHPSSSSQVLLVAACFWGVRALAARPRGRPTALRLAALAGGLALGAALAAVMLVPFAELLGRSSDVASRSSISALLHQPPRFLLGLFLHDYWGHVRSSLLFGSYLPERAYYVAALPLLLAGAGLVARPRVERVAVAAVGALALALATGLTPLYDVVVRLPGLEAANNGRFAVVAVLCLAVLAGWGMDDLTAGRLSIARRRLVVALGLVLLAGPAVVVARHAEADAIGPALRVAWGFAAPRSVVSDAGLPGVVRLASMFEWVLPAAAAVLLVGLRLRGGVRAPTFVALAVLLVAADLFRAGMGYNPAIPVAHATQPTTPALRFLERRRPARFVGLRALAPNSLSLPLPPNVSMRYDVLDGRGYVIPSEERTFRIWRDRIAPENSCFTAFCASVPDSRPDALRALGLMGVSLLLQNRRDPPLPRLPVAYSGRDARIYSNPGALPRAFLVDRQVTVRGGDAALAALTAPGFPARSAVVTEQRLPGLPEGGGGRRPSVGRVHISDYGRERVDLDTSARRPALLVLTDTWYPGWKATVDGAEATIHRVDYVHRGVRVPAGTHRVRFSYEPASWRVGWIVSLLALATLAALAAIGVRRRRAVEEPG